MVTVSFFLVTEMCDSGLILLGEIRYWSLLWVKGLSYFMLIASNQELHSNLVFKQSAVFLAFVLANILFDFSKSRPLLILVLTAL